jgi:prolipoprotein diacylglyceryltransferase
VLYPSARFVVEFVRYHSSNAWIWQDRLSDAQGISLALVATGAWLLASRSQESVARSQNKKAEARR